MAVRIKKDIVESLWGASGKGTKGVSDFLEGPVSKITAPVFQDILDPAAPKLPTTPEKIPIDRLQAVFGKVDDLVESPLFGGIFKGLSSAALTALTLGEIARITNEIPTFRPLRKKFSPTLPGAGDIIESWRRGSLDAEARDVKLAELGFSKPDIQALVKNSWAVPGVQDIISWAVREVYSPEIAKEFGQYEGAEKVRAEAKEDIFRAGMHPEDFDKHWAAHWVLPSILQGFEMLHRKKITPEQLDMLFKALDVMPFWRDKLKAISYVPFTRVDVRRMHKLGVIDADAVKKAYMDIGYADVEAEKMKEFTIAYNSDEDDPSSRKEKQRDLTKSDFLRIFRIGLFTREDTRQGLLALGYDNDESTYLLDREDYLIQEDRFKRFIAAIRKGFLNNTFSDAEVHEKLGKFNLPGDMTSNLLEEWKLEKEVVTAIPSKAEILRWYNKEHIQRYQAESYLRQAGYKREIIEIYLKEKAPSPGG